MPSYRADRDLALYTAQFRALDIWGRTRDTVSPGERDRVDAVVASIPPGTRTVLDVGCGDGLVTNELVDAGYDVVGVDLVPELLAHVRAQTVEASADELPFPDASFDCVVASAVLEHLPSGMFEAALAELTRVARLHIVVDCPHREALVLAQARCDRCLSTFHASHHVRSVDEHDAAGWFPGFRLLQTRLTGEEWPYRSARLQRAAQLLGDVWYRGEGIVCPTCGYGIEPARPNRVVWAANGVLQRLLGRMRGSCPSEFVAVLERDD